MGKVPGKAIVFGVGLIVIIIGAMAVKSRLDRINKEDVAIAAINKIQDPIARAAAYEADPAAAERETHKDPSDISAHLALVHIDTRKNDLVGATHQLEQIVRVDPKDRQYQYLLCGYLIKLGRAREATHRLENLTLKDDVWGKLARADLDKVLAAAGK